MDHGHRGRRPHHDQERSGCGEGDEQGQTRARHAPPGAGDQSKADPRDGEDGGRESQKRRKPEEAQRPARAEEAQAMDRTGQRDTDQGDHGQRDGSQGEARGPTRSSLPLVSVPLGHERALHARGREHTAA